MPKIYLVRHGKAAAGFDGHHDPGLDALGRAQAEATARELEPIGPLAILSSPLARARETAEPLAERWQVDIAIEPRVAEIPSPTEDLQERARWLRQAMAGRWSDLGAELMAWRNALARCLLDLEQDSVVFCHYVAINAAVGFAENDDRMVLFAPDNGSITLLENAGGELRVLELGRTAQTHIN
ncbi:MAG: histidine phosphatase family protein [Pseudomonadales bacterium]